MTPSQSPLTPVLSPPHITISSPYQSTPLRTLLYTPKDTDHAEKNRP
jgi:hypothetical protein